MKSDIIYTQKTSNCTIPFKFLGGHGPKLRSKECTTIMTFYIFI